MPRIEMPNNHGKPSRSLLVTLGAVSILVATGIAAFYGLPLNQEYVVYDHAAWMVPDRYPDDEYPSQLSSLYTLIPGRNLDLVPYRAGEMLGWQLRRE